MPNKKKKILLVVITLFLGINLALPVLLVPKQAEAQLIVHDPVSGAFSLKDTLWKIAKEALFQSAATAFKRTTKMLADRLAYQTALSIASGNTGQNPLYSWKNFGEFWEDNKDAATGDFLQGMASAAGGTFRRRTTEGKCNADQTIPCFTDKECIVGLAEGQEDLSRAGGGVCENAPGRHCYQRLDCTPSADEEEKGFKEGGECLLGKKYVGPCGDTLLGNVWRAPMGIAKGKTINVCKPKSLSTALTITLGLDPFNVPQARQPDCSWSEMEANWDKAVKKSNFLTNLGENWRPEKSSIGTFLTLKTQLAGYEVDRVTAKVDERKEGQGFKPVVERVS